MTAPAILCSYRQACSQVARLVPISVPVPPSFACVRFSWRVVSFVSGVGSVTLGVQWVSLSVPGITALPHQAPVDSPSPPAARAGLSEGAPHRCGVTVLSRTQREAARVVCHSCRSFFSILCPENVLSCSAGPGSVARPCPRTLTSGGCVCWGQSPSRLEASG